MGKIYSADCFSGLFCFYYGETRSGKPPRGSHTSKYGPKTQPKLTNCVGVLSTNCFLTSAAQEVLSPWITIHLMLFDQTFTCCCAFRAAAWQPTTTLVATMVGHKRVGVIVPWTLQCPVSNIKLRVDDYPYMCT
jgi:hypothetical protein